FIKDGWLVRLVRGLYRLALRPAAKVFFQNEDDRQLFIAGDLVRAEVADLLPGSGIDLARFPMTPLNDTNTEIRKFCFLLIARMLRDKGVGEYVAAAKLIRQRWP